MGRVILLLAFCALALAVTNHGPAHREADQHARQSQKLSQKLWKIQQEHTEKLHQNIAEMRAYRPKPEDHDLATLKTIRNRYTHHRNPALSLLEKTSYSRAIPPAEREAEVEGFSEEAMKAILAKEEQARPMNELLEVEEGSQPKHSSLDWKKWEKFMLNEFEAARMTGDLDAAAHALPEPVRSPQSLQLNMELGEGKGIDLGNEKDAMTTSASGALLDKMCGCEVTLEPVCGNNGETYPSSCFAKCAGLEVSHAGPCLSKADLERVDTFEVLHRDTAGNIKADRDASMGIQNLMLFGDDEAEMPPQTQAAYTARAQQEAGVDYPSFDTADATQVARQAAEESTRPESIALPFKRPITARQFDEDLKQLSKVAEQFAPVANDVRMSQCACRGEYAPVCGKDFKTYPSSCYASCMGVELRHIGACHDNTSMEVQSPASLDSVRDPICFCSLKEKRVCGVNGKTYINRCFANCESVKVRQDGPCL